MGRAVIAAARRTRRRRHRRGRQPRPAGRNRRRSARTDGPNSKPSSPSTNRTFSWTFRLPTRAGSSSPRVRTRVSLASSARRDSTTKTKPRSAKRANAVPVLWRATSPAESKRFSELIEGAVSDLPGYDVELMETHHDGKRDAPSGTAKTILDRIAAAGGARRPGSRTRRGRTATIRRSRRPRPPGGRYRGRTRSPAGERPRGPPTLPSRGRQGRVRRRRARRGGMGRRTAPGTVRVQRGDQRMRRDSDIRRRRTGTVATIRLRRGRRGQRRTERTRTLEAFLDALEAGEVRAAEKRDGSWEANEWVKQGILLNFGLRNIEGREYGDVTYHDVLPLRRTDDLPGRRDPQHARRNGPPTGRTRRVEFILMSPSFVNIGAPSATERSWTPVIRSARVRRSARTSKSARTCSSAASSNPSREHPSSSRTT